MSRLLLHAERELRLAGLMDESADYGGALGTSALELVETFTKQGHSGASAALAIQLFTKLAGWQNLTPITSDPSEWNDITEAYGSPMWQAKRNPAIFSKDGGEDSAGRE